LNPPVPEWLESLTARLLAKSPDERVESAAALAGILEAELAYLQNPRSAPQPMRDWMPRNIARQRRRANARYYALCGLAVLVLAACFAVAARLPDAPMTSGSTPSPARSNVPLWGADGMSDAQRLTAEIESRWSATPTLPADAWNVLRDDAERQSDALLRQNSTDTSF
jgi:hypothetical protein